MVGYVGVWEPDPGFQGLDQLIYNFDLVSSTTAVEGFGGSEATEEGRCAGAGGGCVEEFAAHI